MTNPSIRLPIEETLSESWKHVKGTKASYWAAYGITILIYIGFSLIDHFFIAPFIAPEIQAEANHVQIDFHSFPIIINGILSVIVSLFTFLLRIGILLIGIENAKNQPISYKLMFQSLHFRTALRLISYTIIQLLVVIGLIFTAPFLSIPKSFLFANFPALNAAVTALIYIVTFCLGIYFTTRLSLGYAFILEKKSSLFSAIKLSFHATRCNVLRLIFLYFIIIIIMIVSIIPLGIGLIWTIPLYMNTYGMVYKKLTANN